MNNQSIIRFGGIAAMVSAVLYVVSLGLSFSTSTAVLGTVLYVASSLAFLVTLVALYLDLRATAATPSLIALLLLGAMTVWSLFLNPADISPAFGPLTLVYGLGFLLFGWVQYGSKHYAKGIGLAALVGGGLAVIAGLALMAGASADLFGLLNLALSVPYLIWLVWLGRHYLQGKAASLQAA